MLPCVMKNAELRSNAKVISRRIEGRDPTKGWFPERWCRYILLEYLLNKPSYTPALKERQGFKNTQP